MAGMDDNNDLFGNLDKQTPAGSRGFAPGRSAGASREASCRDQGWQRRLQRRRHRGAGRAGAGAAASRHVYRRHRRKGDAPSVRRGHRQFDGRGGRRPRHLHRCRAFGRRVSDRHRQWPRHPGRSASEIQEVGARSHHDDAACRAANSTPRSTRPPAACTASASPSSTRCRTISRSRSRAAASSTASDFRAAFR